MATGLVMVPRVTHAAAAGRTIAWRLLFFAVVVVQGTSFAASSREPSVDVVEQDGVYRVAASFAVAQSAPDVVRVLTDYARIPDFMPDVQTSQVLERLGTTTRVEQTAVSKFMMFSKRIHLLLEVTQEDGVIHFRDTCGKSFLAYEGAWIIVPRDGHVTVDYRLAARPAFEVPGFVLKRLLKRDALAMIVRLQNEIAERSLQRE
jgi:hypothetical protein